MIRMADIIAIKYTNRIIKHRCKHCHKGFLTKHSKEDHEGRCKYGRTW